jgi:aldehyde dehydrogenase (NAD+)
MLTYSSIQEIISQQRQFFATGTPKNLEFRLNQLKKLKQVILENQEAILDALKADLNKPRLEAYLAEMSVTQDIDYAMKHLKSWAKPKKVPVPLTQFPASASVYSDPLGVVLIISPWNYPFSLAISPLIGAIAAGNCAVIKPSEISANTSQILAKVINKNFEPGYLKVIEGGVETSQELLKEKFDYIFFTGGTKIGKVVMEAAAKHLTPVTLELGGKSPCIVETDIDLKTAAKRIIWGKFLNAGQTCVAPDYLLVNYQIKQDFLQALKGQIQEFYGSEPAKSSDYCRIINSRQFDRLVEFLKDGKIIIGGEVNRSQSYIAPTILDQVSWDAPIMEDEIFGPILPVLEYQNLSEAIQKINERPKPLALYLFSKNKEKQEQVLRETSSGGVCLNDTIMQLGIPELPFGGVGNSGMGQYHGKASFDTFSHQKSVLRKTFGFSLDFIYPPYTEKKLGLIQKIFKSSK